MARPILLNSCAKAATAAEARFRIDYELAPSRATRVVALDEVAATVVRHVSALDWHTARFYVCDDASAAGYVDGLGLDVVAGERVALVDELDGVDAVILIASDSSGAAVAATIGAACTGRGVMTAGIVLDVSEVIGPALSALRPHARVLLVPGDEEDLVELLRAIRA
jgi:hypothetical protein